MKRCLGLQGKSCCLSRTEFLQSYLRLLGNFFVLGFVGAVGQSPGDATFVSLGWPAGFFVVVGVRALSLLSNESSTGQLCAQAFCRFDRGFLVCTEAD